MLISARSYRVSAQNGPRAKVHTGQFRSSRRGVPGTIADGQPRALRRQCRRYAIGKTPAAFARASQFKARRSKIAPGLPSNSCAGWNPAAANTLRTSLLVVRRVLEHFKTVAYLRLKSSTSSARNCAVVVPRSRKNPPSTSALTAIRVTPSISAATLADISRCGPIPTDN